MSSPRLTDPRPLVAFDWSLHGVHVTHDGEQVTFYPSVTAFLDALSAPHQICAEATFESWDPQARRDLVGELRSRGHELYVYRPLHTARARGKAIKKSNENDARVIYAIASAGTMHLYPLPDPDPVWAAFRERCNRDYDMIRRGGGKGELAAAAMRILGRYQDLSPEQRSVLGNDRVYSPTFLAATYFVALRTRSRPVFERLLGLHGSGYPTLLRSEIHTHCFRHAMDRGVDWTTYRRVLRQTLALYRAAGVGAYGD